MEPKPKQSNLKRLLGFLRIAVGIGLLIWLVRSGSISAALLNSLVSHWDLTLLGIALFFTANLLATRRTQVLIKAQALSLSFYAAFRLTFIGLFFNTFLPGAVGGDLMKIYYATKGNPSSRAQIITVLFLDRFVGMFCLVSVPLLIAPFFWQMVSAQPVLQGLLAVSLMTSVALVATMIIASMPNLLNSRVLTWCYERLPLGGALKNVVFTVHSYRRKVGVVAHAMILSYGVHALNIGVLLVIAQATIPDGANWKMVPLIPLGFLANSAPVTPGGIGVGEAAFESLFGLFGMSGGAQILFVWRLMMLTVGVIGLFFYLKGEKRLVYSG